MRRKIIAIVISLVIIILSIMLVILPKKDFSENENRYLQKFPTFKLSTLISGEYIPKVENFLSDHFPFRDKLINFKTGIYKLMGNTKINEVYLGKDEYLIEEYKKPNNSDKIIATINRFSEKLKDHKIYFMLAPTCVSIYPEKLPKYAVNASQLETIDYYYNNLENINTINIYDTFQIVKNDIDLYYRLDHHWTTFGAYVAYLEYCHTLKITPEINFSINKISDNFKGTIYSKVIDNSLTPDTMYSMTNEKAEYIVNYVATNRKTNTLYEEKYLNQKDKYSYFLDNNNPLIVIENKLADNDNEILVIKDSYANSFIPFLTYNYSKVHVIDPRYYRGSISEYSEENNLKEILFLYNVQTIDTDLGIVSIQ